MNLPSLVTVQIEVPRGSFIKRGSAGELDFVSPLPCPFNYGSLPSHTGGDGDPLDALVLGPALGAGETVQTTVYAVVRFLDAGKVDDKLICGAHRPTWADKMSVLAFFSVYARAKRAMYRLRGVSGDTRLVGWVWSGSGGEP